MRTLAIIIFLAALLVLCGCGTVKVYYPEPVIEYQTKYIYDLRDFGSEQEFFEWYNTLNRHDAESNHCADIAKWYCQMGANDGYYVYYKSCVPDEYSAIFPNGWNLSGNHAINWVIAGDVRIYVDTTNGIISPYRWSSD